MTTVGVDLAASAKGTAVAAVRWTPAGARLVTLEVDVGNDRILQVARGATKIGIDCPLGWPTGFVDFVRRHEQGSVRPSEAEDIAGRQHLALRRTDLFVTEQCGARPLSVSTDRIGRAALRAAGLVAALASVGIAVDRTGRAGRVVEVYPAAALRIWGHAHSKYKGSAGQGGLAALVSAFCAAAPWLAVTPEHRAQMVGSDDAFDAVVAAVIARAVALRLVLPIPRHDVATARVEGWIALPSTPLADLDPTAPGGA